MVFRQIAQGRIKARAWPIQAVVPVTPLEQLSLRFGFNQGKPVVNDTDRRVIHWAGAKPYLTGEASFPQPMVHYRLEHLRNMRSFRRRLGRLGLMLEEVGTRITEKHEGSYLRAVQSKARWIIGRATKRLRLKPPARRAA